MNINHFKKSAIIFLIGFFILFALRTVYTFKISGEQSGNNFAQTTTSIVNNGERKEKNNYASTKAVVVAAQTAKSVSVDQKYERIGFLTSESNNFDEDSGKIKNIIQQNNAIVQFEDNSGIKGNKTLDLSIGVHPDKFDEFVEQLKKIANLVYFKVQKTDKTSEYRDLKAKQITIENYKAALVKLKEKGGNINDLIALENKILEIDEKVQGFGVQLGDYNQENELCTVKITLKENMGIVKKDYLSLVFISKTLIKAFVWSIGYYFLFLFLILLGGISGCVLIILIGKAKKTIDGLRTKSVDKQKSEIDKDESDESN